MFRQTKSQDKIRCHRTPGAVKRNAPVKGVLALLALALSMFSTPPGLAKTSLTIGGGSPAGVYQEFARATCDLVNAAFPKTHRCRGRTTLGSVYNIRAVTRRVMEFGITQSDQHYFAWKGLGDWQGTPQTNLRSVFSIHYEYANMVARADRSIGSLADLKGRRVNLGNPGSGQRTMGEDVLQLHGLDWRRDVALKGLAQAEATNALIDGKIDAFFYTVGLGADAIERPASKIGIKLLPIESGALRDFVAERPYYFLTKIPAGTYAGVNEDVPTYAVQANLVTAAETDEQLVYDLVRVVFEHLPTLRATHPAFSQLEARDMVDGLISPIHPGALRYYRERGWK